MNKIKKKKFLYIICCIITLTVCSNTIAKIKTTAENIYNTLEWKSEHRKKELRWKKTLDSKSLTINGEGFSINVIPYEIVLSSVIPGTAGVRVYNKLLSEKVKVEVYGLKIKVQYLKNSLDLKIKGSVSQINDSSQIVTMTSKEKNLLFLYLDQNVPERGCGITCVLFDITDGKIKKVDLYQDVCGAMD